MRVVIHAGMHKTGSTSIQRCFSHDQHKDVTYACTDHVNLSDIALLLFQDESKFLDLKRPHFRDLSVADIRARRTHEAARLAQRLQTATTPVFLFSAEDISSPAFDQAATQRLYHSLNQGQDISVLAYVRTPISFMQSAFQQRIKQQKPGAGQLDPQTLWPQYRARFEKFDTVFGAARTQFKVFNPKTFSGGDIITDFADELGVDLSKTPQSFANKGLSLEAIAVLFVKLKEGDRFLKSADDGLRQNFNMLQAIDLRSFGHQKFSFAPSFLGPAFDTYKADLEWIETRVGHCLNDFPTQEAQGGTQGSGRVSSEEDLMQIAQDAYEPLITLLRDLPRQRRRLKAQRLWNRTRQKAQRMLGIPTI